MASWTIERPLMSSGLPIATDTAVAIPRRKACCTSNDGSCCNLSDFVHKDKLKCQLEWRFVGNTISQYFKVAAKEEENCTGIPFLV